jgi:hypothetical protein
MQISPVTQITVCVNSELRLARKRPAVSPIPIADVTFALFIAADAERASRVLSGLLCINLSLYLHYT